MWKCVPNVRLIFYLNVYSFKCSFPKVFLLSGFQCTWRKPRWWSTPALSFSSSLPSSKERWDQVKDHKTSWRRIGYIPPIQIGCISKWVSPSRFKSDIWTKRWPMLVFSSSPHQSLVDDSRESIWLLTRGASKGEREVSFYETFALQHFWAFCLSLTTALA